MDALNRSLEHAWQQAEAMERERDKARNAMKQLRVYLLCASWIVPSASGRIFDWMDEHCPWLTDGSPESDPKPSVSDTILDGTESWSIK